MIGAPLGLAIGAPGIAEVIITGPALAMAGYINGPAAARSSLPALNFKAVTGTTFSLLVTVEDYAADLYDAEEIEFYIAPRAEMCGVDECQDCAVIMKDLGAGITVTDEKQFRIDFAASDTASLDAGEYVFDIRIADAGAVFAVRRKDMSVGVAHILDNLSLCGK